MILTLHLDKIFPAKACNWTLPSGFSFHCPENTFSAKYFLTFLSFLNFLCHVPLPLFESHVCYICTPLFIPCIPGEVQFCCSCVCWRWVNGIVGLYLFLLGHAAHQHPICLAGTWTSFPFPPMPAQTSCLRRVPITLTQRWYQNVVQPCCLEPKSLLFWSTLLTEPIHGIR